MESHSLAIDTPSGLAVLGSFFLRESGHRRLPIRQSSAAGTNRTIVQLYMFICVDNCFLAYQGNGAVPRPYRVTEHDDTNSEIG
jgi:hypothetical protein